MKVIDSRPCTYRDCGQQLVERDGHRAIPHWHADDAHSATADCHTYTPKEEPMPKREPLTVHIGRVNQLIEYEAFDGVTDVEVTVLVKGVGDDSPLRSTLGRAIAMAGTVDALVRSVGPSPEEQRVIDEAVKWFDRMVAMYGPEYVVEDPKTWVHDLAVAVKAMKGGR